MSTSKTFKAKNYLLQGSILAMAALIARVIGMIYRVPLTRILGDTGNTYYSTANEIYMIILIISSNSLPLAISKMVAARLNKGEIRNAEKVFHCALKLAVTVGAVMAFACWALAGVLTSLMKCEPAKYALQVIAPAILVFAITGVFRGFFQGFGNMVPTAVSQIVEQIVNAVVTVVCAGVMLRYGMSLAAKEGNALLGPAWAAAGGTFGTVASVTVAMIFMMVLYTANRQHFSFQASRDKTSYRESDREIMIELKNTILPIVGFAVLYNLTSIIDQGIFNWITSGQGYNEAQYTTIWGIYVGKFRILMNVVLALASSLGPAIVPSMTAVSTKSEKKEAGRKVAVSTRFTMLFSIPGAFGLAALGGPVVEMLFHPQTGVPLAAGIIQAGAPMIILFALSTLTTSILQGLGHEKEPLIHCGIAMAAHLVMLVVLLKTFELNIYGVIFANTFFALIICILNARTIASHLHYRQEVLRTFFIPTVASVVMAFAAFGIYHLFHMFLGVTIPVILAIMGGAVIYGVGLVALKGISAEEILSLPKGRTILRLVRKTGLMR